ncbi:MAG: hypothetical protein ACYC5N_03480 [Endomicrobiales bacterium]
MDANLTKAVNLGFAYSLTGSTSVVDTTRAFSLNCGVKLNDNASVGMSVTSTPEANDTRSGGWGLNGYCGGGAGPVYWRRKMAVVSTRPR